MTQNRQILEHLKDVGDISAMEAWNIYKVRSMSSRVSELRKAGHEIKSQHKTDHTGQRYVRYIFIR